MSAALTMAEVRSAALESHGDFLRRVAGIVSQEHAPDMAPPAADWLFRVSLDLDASGGDAARCAVPASAEEAMDVAREILRATGSVPRD